MRSESRRKLFLFIIFGMLLVLPSFVSSEIKTTYGSSGIINIGTFKLATEIDLKQSCVNATKVCDSCNITSIVNPNSTDIIQDVIMTQRGADFNYTLNISLNNLIGKYTVKGICIAGTEINNWAYPFSITKTGFQQSTSRSIFYLILSIGVFLAFLLSLYFNLTVSSDNASNEHGDIIAVTKTKYLKFMLILVTYPLGLWFLNILIAISDNFVELNLFYGFFSFAFGLLLRLSYPLFVFVFVVIIFNVFRDAKINEKVKKFGGVRND